MGTERGGPSGDTVCPRCRRRRDTRGEGAPGDQAPAGDHVDWAGLPVNLDLVFSQQQCDKVLVQHLTRKRETQLWRWPQSGALPCACAVAAGGGRHSPDAAGSLPSR